MRILSDSVLKLNDAKVFDGFKLVYNEALKVYHPVVRKGRFDSTGKGTDILTSVHFKVSSPNAPLTFADCEFIHFLNTSNSITIIDNVVFEGKVFIDVPGNDDYDIKDSRIADSYLCSAKVIESSVRDAIVIGSIIKVCEIDNSKPFKYKAKYIDFLKRMIPEKLRSVNSAVLNKWFKIKALITSYLDNSMPTHFRRSLLLKNSKVNSTFVGAPSSSIVSDGYVVDVSSLLYAGFVNYNIQIFQESFPIMKVFSLENFKKFGRSQSIDVLRYHPSDNDLRPYRARPHQNIGSNLVGLEIEVIITDFEIDRNFDQFAREFLFHYFSKRKTYARSSMINSPEDITSIDYAWFLTNVAYMSVDGSLDGQGIEFVFKATDWKSQGALLTGFIAALQKVNASNKNNFKIPLNDARSGTHINVSKPSGFNREKLEFLGKILYNPANSPAGESWLRFSKRPTRSGYAKYDSSSMSEYSFGKYNGINNKDNVLEFRLFQGGYRSEVRVIKGWIACCKGLVDFANECYDQYKDIADSITIDNVPSPNPLMQKWLDWMRTSQYSSVFFSRGGGVLKAFDYDGIQFPANASVHDIIRALHM